MKNQQAAVLLTFDVEWQRKELVSELPNAYDFASSYAGRLRTLNETNDRRNSGGTLRPSDHRVIPAWSQSGLIKVPGVPKMSLK